jgi:sugar lactone lactonase YvrE
MLIQYVKIQGENMDKKKSIRRILIICAFGFLGVILAVIIIVRVRYGGGTADFPDRTTTPIFSFNVMEKVADLDVPPGNIAVSRDGRIFVSLHPEARPDIRVAELINGRVVPYPSLEFQGPGKSEVYFDTVLSVRIDNQNRLWTLDLANHGFGQPRLLSFDLSTGRVIHQFDFSESLAGPGSHLNDFQIDPSGENIYIADASIFGKTPAILVYNKKSRYCRRVLEKDISVIPEKFIPVVQGREMNIFGLFAIRPGVDSIALDKSGDWLYFAPVTNNHLCRVHTKYLKNDLLSSIQLSSHVEEFALKPMSDGLTMDVSANIYITDPEHSAIVRLLSNGKLETLLKNSHLRWPDGLGFGPDGWLYVTCSALHQVIGKTPGFIRSHAPFQIYRFKPGVPGIPGQ